MNDGQLDSIGRYWFRCTNCGDSNNPRKAHAVLNENGSTHCFKCGHHTNASISRYIENNYIHYDTDKAKEIDRLRVNKQYGRATKLVKYQTEGLVEYDTFEMRNSNGLHRGWHNRNTMHKVCSNEGKRGLGFVGDELISSIDRPLIIVEGPYDVIQDNYVCVFGSINKSCANLLGLQYIWLFPDPDIIDTPLKIARFKKAVISPMMYSLVLLQGVILGDDDPDKAKHIHYMTTEYALNNWS